MKKMIAIFISVFMVLSLVACDNDSKPKDTKFDKSGTFDKEESLGNVTITADDVVLKNKVINGDLNIQVPGDGDVTLHNVTVGGKITVTSTGSEYAINLGDVKASSMDITSSAQLRLYASNGTDIKNVKSNTGLVISENDLSKDGFSNVTIDGAADASVTLISTGLNVLEVKNATNTIVMLDSATLVTNMIINAPLDIVGKGSIDLLNANANVNYETEPAVIRTAEGVLVNGGSTAVTTPKETTPKVTTSPKVTTTQKQTTTTKKTTTTPKVTTPKVTTTTTTTTKPNGNTVPMISAPDMTINVNATFNAMSGVVLYDKEDGGYIAVTAAMIKSNNVNTAVAGIYSVVYTYTDKGGLTATATRKVTVTGTSTGTTTSGSGTTSPAVTTTQPKSADQLDQPLNLKWAIDKDGGLEVTWSPVANAVAYDVYVNGRLADQGLKRPLSFVEDLIKPGRDNEIKVIAYPADGSKLKASHPSYVTYKDNPGYIKMPDKIYIADDKNTMIDFRFNPLLIPYRGVSTVVMTLEVKDGRGYVPAEDIRLIYPKITDAKGQIKYHTYPNAGDEIEAQFRDPGVYLLTMDVLDVNGRVLYTMTKDFSVIGTGGSTGGTEDDYEPTITSAQVFYNESGVSIERDKWDYEIEFEVPYDIDLGLPNTSLLVYYLYVTPNGTTKTSSCTFNGDSFSSRGVVKASDNHVATLKKGCDSVLDKAVQDAITAKTAVEIQAIVDVKIRGTSYQASTSRSSKIW